MKRIVVVLIAVLHPWVAFGGEEKFEVWSGAFGPGSHRDPGVWDGHEKIVSRLTKDGMVVLLVRVSESDFEVRIEGSSEIYFKFSKTLGGFSPGLVSPLLVDFQRQDGKVTVLTVGNDGYYMARAQNHPPKVEPPKHWLPLRVLETEKWYLTEVMRMLDPYPDSTGIQAGIHDARLNDLGDVEFRLTADNVKPEQIDVFSIGNVRTRDSGRFGTLCFKNGKVLNHLWAARGYAPFIMDEHEEATNLRDFAPRVIKSYCDGRFADKDEGIIWFRKNFQDKQAAEEIVQAIEKAYSNEAIK